MNEFVEDERGLIAFQTFSIKNEDDAEKGSAKTIYYTEEMVAQILAYGKFLAERQAGGAVVDTVLTVPSYFTQE
jgi:molecular chaperone DnaK (HSP70)